jgi:hypothetical protein
MFNRIPLGKEKKTPLWEVGWDEIFTFVFTHMDVLEKVNIPINKKCKLAPKTVDCIFQ